MSPYAEIYSKYWLTDLGHIVHSACMAAIAARRSTFFHHLHGHRTSGSHQHLWRHVREWGYWIVWVCWGCVIFWLGRHLRFTRPPSFPGHIVVEVIASGTLRTGKPQAGRVLHLVLGLGIGLARGLTDFKMAYFRAILSLVQGFFKTSDTCCRYRCRYRCWGHWW